MKVLDLKCEYAHVFEGWFGSEADFQEQLGRRLVQCPTCGSASVSKQVTAARLNLSGAREPPSGAKPQLANASTAAAKPNDSSPEPTPPNSDLAKPESAQFAQMHAAYMQVVTRIMANTTDVGSAFAQEARDMHYGDAPERAIRGQATRQEAMELLEEGIGILPLVVPEQLKGTLQ